MFPSKMFFNLNKIICFLCYGIFNKSWAILSMWRILIRILKLFLFYFFWFILLFYLIRFFHNHKNWSTDAYIEINDISFCKCLNFFKHSDYFEVFHSILKVWLQSVFFWNSSRIIELCYVCKYFLFFVFVMFVNTFCFFCWVKLCLLILSVFFVELCYVC
jgi:hypothetical protein